MALKTIPVDEMFRRHMSVRHMARIDKRADATVHRLLLRELRKSLGLTQKQLSAVMGVSQPVLSQLENRADFHLATLRRVVSAMGGELDIIARFPDRTVAIQV
jgi:plasmid maintenance system antidote protein VapI